MRICLLLAGLIVLAGCPSLDGYNPVADEVPPTEDLVWVATDYVGGVQCDPKDTYAPPDVRRLLERADVPVYKTEIEHHGVCGACSCPAYAAAHYALIDRERLKAARRLGFAEQQPRTYEEN